MSSFYIGKVVLCLLIIFTAMTSCGDKESRSISNTRINYYNENRSISTFDYNSCIKKMWVIKEWSNGMPYRFPASLVITKIENNQIEGILVARSMYSTYPFEKASNLSGTIVNDVAECKVMDKESGDEASIILKFGDNDEIEAYLEYAKVYGMEIDDYNCKVLKEYKDKDSIERFPEELLPMIGVYTFRPYNLRDISTEDYVFIANEELSFDVELDSWGRVKFISGIFNGTKPYPSALLVNEKNDILFEFKATWKTSTKVVDVEIEDMNEDGLKDVKIITNFVNPNDFSEIYNDMPTLVWDFHQNADGQFMYERPT